MSTARTQRRSCLRGMATAVLPAFLPVWVANSARAQPASGPPQLTLQQMTAELVGDAPLRREGVRLEMAALADNGHVVPLRVTVTSAMTAAEHVTRIWLLSPRNPVTRMAVFHLGPWSGRAEIATRVRLAGTQEVVALARLSSGEFRYAQAEVVVTESACLDAG